MRANATVMVVLLMVSGCFSGGAEDTAPDPVAGTDGAPGADDVPPSPSLTGFALTATQCSELVVIVEAPVASVRNEIPEEAVLVGQASGSVPLRTNHFRCSGATLDGRPMGAFQMSEWYVQIEAPDGRDGTNYIDLWMLTNHTAFHAALVAAGWPTGYLATGWGGDLMDDGTTQTRSHDIPWTEGAYRLAGVLRQPPAPATVSDVNLWAFANGTWVVNEVRGSFDITHVGDASVDAAGRSARALGADSKAGAGLFARSDTLDFMVVAH